MNLIEEIKKPILNDQDILNSACQSNVLYIGNEWNYDWNIENFEKQDSFTLSPDKYLTKDEYNDYLYSKKYPKIIHYAGPNKPWNKPFISMSDIFWEYARECPFYEEIFYENLKIKETKIENKSIYKNIWQRIFSIKNIKLPLKTYKIITILGIKIKIRKKYAKS